MTNRKNFPKALITSKKQLPRGQHKFLCCENITAVVWCDRQPIYFLSTYHDPAMTTSINRKNKDGTVTAVKCPQLVVDYNRFMGGVDQMAKLFKPRKHYRWSRCLFLKCVMWVCYNAYIVAGHYIPHRKTGSRLYTFANFTEDCVDGLIADFQSTASVRRYSDEQIRLQNVGVHFPERAVDATGNNRCRVCREKFSPFQGKSPRNPGQGKSP